MTNFKYIIIALISSSFAIGQYNEIEGKVIEDYDPSAEFTNEHIMPNELNPHTYANELKDLTGLLISVGTFRSLIAFSLGKFERLIMLDLDHRILKFNRKHIDDIKELMNSFPDNLEKQREIYIENYGKYLREFEDSPSNPYYWNDNEKWKRITNAIDKKYIYVIQGDLDDLDTTKALINIIENKFYDYSLTIDISNVPGHLETMENLKSFLKMIAQASRKSKTILLTSVTPLVDEPSLAAKKDWYYYYSDLSRYISYLNKLETIGKKEKDIMTSLKNALNRIKALEDKIK